MQRKTRNYNGSWLVWRAGIRQRFALGKGVGLLLGSEGPQVKRQSVVLLDGWGAVM
jgi:hypothetical protein